MVGICIISSCHQRYIDLESTYNEAMKIVMMPDSAVSPLRGVKNERKKTMQKRYLKPQYTK